MYFSVYHKIDWHATMTKTLQASTMLIYMFKAFGNQESGTFLHIMTSKRLVSSTLVKE